MTIDSDGWPPTWSTERYDPSQQGEWIIAVIDRLLEIENGSAPISDLATCREILNWALCQSPSAPSSGQ